MNQPRILIVDDESIMLNALADTLRTGAYYIQTASNPVSALEVIRKDDFHLLITDLKMPGMNGLELVKKAREINPELLAIVITAFGTVENAVDAMKLGVSDFIEKPFSFDKIELSISRALSTVSLIRENSSLKKQLKLQSSSNELSSKSPVMKKVIHLIERVSELNVTVLITGESGTGKELAAEQIHKNSPRSDGPMIRVNCAALPETLLESELFGHVKGAFTGAVSNKKGRFELAHTGTLFLDEIGEISPQIQVKLLRALQEKVIEPVGGEQSISVDVRLLAATNRDLIKEIALGNFREDLYYRLNVLNVHLPPLRERKEDIPDLVNRFINKFSSEMGKKITGITSPALRVLLSYSWPGNIRELENCIQRALVLTTGDTITEEFIFPEKITETISVDDTLENLEKRHISNILDRENWNVTRVSGILGIDRKTLYNKINRYGLKHG